MKNYPKMCDTSLIQDGWEPKVGDWTDKGMVYTIEQVGRNLASYRLTNTVTMGKPYLKVQLTWLPTIEQLMGMIDTIKHSGGRYTAISMIGKIERWILHSRIYKPLELGVMKPRELWLAFVMHELHNLKWNGNIWWR